MVAPSTSGCPHRDWEKSLTQYRSGQAQAAFEGEVGRDRAIRFRDEISELNLGG
jgi:hypothetical protein